MLLYLQKPNQQFASQHLLKIVLQFPYFHLVPNLFHYILLWLLMQVEQIHQTLNPLFEILLLLEVFLMLLNFLPLTKQLHRILI